MILYSLYSILPSQVRLSPGPPHQYALSFENPESADLQNGQVRNGEVARIEVQIFDQYYNPTPPRDDLPEREVGGARSGVELWF